MMTSSSLTRKYNVSQQTAKEIARHFNLRLESITTIFEEEKRARKFWMTWEKKAAGIAVRQDKGSFAAGVTYLEVVYIFWRGFQRKIAKGTCKKNLRSQKDAAERCVASSRFRENAGIVDEGCFQTCKHHVEQFSDNFQVRKYYYILILRTCLQYGTVNKDVIIPNCSL